MEKLIIQGGTRLNGTVSVGGAKNAALPVMTSFLLAGGKSRLDRVPALNDVKTLSELLALLGPEVDFTNGSVTIDATNITSHIAPYKLVSRMRASFYVLGPLLARLGRAKVSLPGGCAWGPRPVNLHLAGLEALGAEIEIEHGYVVAKAKRLVGKPFHFDVSSVGATAQLMMAATLAKGTTVLTNSACEPEIGALAECLRQMGARIEGDGTRTVRIEGVDSLAPVTYENIPDRIEAGTFLIAGAMGGGEVVVDHIRPDHLDALTEMLTRVGASVSVLEDAVLVKGVDRPKAVDVTTDIYPGYPTDLQAQAIALLSIADGTSRITDTIYTDRFAHVPELRRLGADIEMTANVAAVKGVPKLQGAYVRSKDLRASAALILAAIVAEGETHVTHIHHLDRGYEQIEDKLRGLGVTVERMEDPNGEDA